MEFAELEKEIKSLEDRLEKAYLYHTRMFLRNEDGLANEAKFEIEELTRKIGELTKKKKLLRGNRKLKELEEEMELLKNYFKRNGFSHTQRYLEEIKDLTEQIERARKNENKKLEELEEKMEGLEDYMEMLESDPNQSRSKEKMELMRKTNLKIEKLAEEIKVERANK